MYYAMTRNYIIPTNSIYGVMWDYSSSSTALTRLTESSDPNGYVNTNITTAPSPAVGTGSGSSPFDNFMPWVGMEEYNIVSNAVGAKKGESGFSRTNNDTVVFIPEYYYKIVDDSSNSKRYFYIADAATTGFTKHPGSGKYVGKYNTIPGYYSKSGSAPLTNITIGDARTGSTSKGDRWCQYDYAAWCAIWLLYLIEFSDWDSQAKIGRGIVNLSSASNTGLTDTMTYHTGRAAGTDGSTAVQYRWIENLWGNLYAWLDGINFNNHTAYICTDRTKYTESDSPYYINAGKLTEINDTSIKALLNSESFEWAFLPSDVHGISTTYIPDALWSTTGRRPLRVGGRYNSGLEAGLFEFDFYTEYTPAGNDAGARLLFNPQGSGDMMYCLLRRRIFPKIKHTYTISVTIDHGSVSGAGDYLEGSQCTLTAKPSSGYTFISWDIDGQTITQNPFTFTVTDNITAVATTRKSTVTITMTNSGSTTSAQARYLEYNGTNYTSGSFTCQLGSTITCYVRGYGSSRPGTVKINGATVFSQTSRATGSYNWIVPNNISNASVTFTRTSYSSYYYCDISITTS